eukprot:1150050-Pelagomonas_calceolata.AAC.7
MHAFRARTSARHRLVAFCVVAASMLTANCAHPFVHRHMLSTKPQGENASGSSNLRSQDQASRKVPAEQDVPNSSRQEQLPEILAQHESSSAVEQWQILVNASDQDVSQLPSPQELFQSSRSVYIPPEYASKVRDLSKGNEEAIKEAEEGRLEAPVGVRNTTISDPSKWAGWQAEEDRGEYDFGGNLGESSEQDKEDGKVYVMKQLAQSSYGGRRALDSRLGAEPIILHSRAYFFGQRVEGGGACPAANRSSALLVSQQRPVIRHQGNDGYGHL